MSQPQLVRGYEVVIGLENHVQLTTVSKIFSGASTAFGAEPNTQACPVDLALPGVLPVMNKAAVDRAIRFGLAVGAKVAPLSIFARKNYFYPDLPKGYQISQYELPIATRGAVRLPAGARTEVVGITRVHLEEDAGKSLHHGQPDSDTMTSLDHCGGCGMSVPTRAHATRTCTSGRPGFACETGYADCNGVADDGCEVDLRADPTHCGSCTTLCNPPNGTAGCNMGQCTIAMCREGFRDCDMNPTNGCEIDTNNTVTHCGMCGNVCPTRANAIAACVMGTCDQSCRAGFQECDGNAANGCEVDIRTDANNCGGCNFACRVANATAACAMGRCAVGMCNAGFADCNMMAADGCEVNTQVDETHCGSCATVCMAPGGTPVCRAGMCGINMCNVGLEDCDMSAGNGCEVNTQTDVRNCGGCGSVCNVPNATAGCAAGRCTVASCNAGFADCNTMAADGCEVNTRADLNHCGGCGMACRPANATGACNTGRCEVMACNAGFADCNMMAADGCEVNTLTSAAHCGACGRACASGQACQGGVCTRFPSTGAEGPFAPTANVTITPGVHNHTTINIPAGVTVRVSGSGVVDLRATGDVTVAGTIDVSGGNGGGGANCVCGSGGGTGTATQAASGTTCAGGAGTTGAAGTAGATMSGGAGGANGGGAGGLYGGGGGGGGFSGGVGGNGNEISVAGQVGGRAGGTEPGGGGTTSSRTTTSPIAGTQPTACYRGGTGTAAPDNDIGSVSGGGGGSIGATAAADLDVTEATFRPGSAGGGGGGGLDGSGCAEGETGGGGGGGGGGAVRIATTTQLNVTGAVIANGGTGGTTLISGDDCGDDTGGPGGSGSGGVVFLYAPRMAVSGRVTAAGGPAVLLPRNSCGTVGTLTGGGGGLGRVRISVDNMTTGACALGGMFNPPLASGCASAMNACQAVIRRFPE